MSTVMERYPSGRAMDPTRYDGASAGFHLSSMSQPDPAVNFGATQYQSRTLPRSPRPRGGIAPPPTAACNSRRRVVSSRVSDYLKSLNSMTRSIVLEKEYVEERHAGEWQRMDETLQEEVVDDYFMPPDVHAHYGTLPRSRRSLREPRSPSAASSEQRFSFRNARVPNTLSQSPEAAAYPTPSSPTQTYFIPPTHNRLHKNQLSYRSKALRKVMNLPPPPTDPLNHHYHQRQQQQQQQPHHEKRDSGLGSDGESPRTSDEDQNLLGFQRNHLRSFSLRQKKGSGRNHGSLSRSSTRRAPQRITGSENTARSSTNSAGGSRLRTKDDRGYDGEVDLPDDSLLHDHMTTTTTTTTHNQTGSRSPPKPSRYSSRIRRSARMMQPRILVDKFSTEDEEEEKEAFVIPNSISRVASNSSASTVTSTLNDFDTTVPMYRNQPAVVLTNLRRVHSEDSIDTDTESIAQSNISNLSKSTGILTEDELLSDVTIPTCLTPESLLSAPSPLVSSGSKRGLVRSRPQSRRGGSFLQTSTSEFADRRAQFKPNMLRNQLSAHNSPTHTRQSTPSFSRQNTPGVTSPTPHSRVTSPTPHSGVSSPTPHPNTPSTPRPPPSSLSLKHRRSSTSGGSIDVPLSPEHLLSPHTPLVKSVSASGGSVSRHLHIRKDSSEQQKRESGYISSSSESFPFPPRK